MKRNSTSRTAAIGAPGRRVIRTLSPPRTATATAPRTPPRSCTTAASSPDRRIHQERPVLLLGDHDPGRVPLRGRPDALKRVPVEEQPALVVPRPRGPIQHRNQELEVVFDHPVGHGFSARSDPACASFANEAVPVPLGQDGRVAVLSEEAEEHVHGGSVVHPQMHALGGRHVLTVDVKERSPRRAARAWHPPRRSGPGRRNR